MKQIFINLPVKDLELSAKFYESLGFTRYSLFTDEDSKSMIYNENIYLMLQSHKFFTDFTQETIDYTTNNQTATFTLPLNSLNLVNETVENALRNGGTEISPMIDEGFMQVRTVKDLDGHIRGIIYLDIEKFKKMTGRS